MLSTGHSEKGPTYFSGICDIIRACKDADILELHLGELSLFRTQDGQYLAFSNRNPKKVPPAWDRPSPEERQQGSNSLSRQEKDLLEAQELMAREEIEANLPLTDPVEWEKMQLAELEGKATGMTAEQVADLDEEELL